MLVGVVLLNLKEKLFFLKECVLALERWLKVCSFPGGQSIVPF